MFQCFMLHLSISLPLQSCFVDVVVVSFVLLDMNETMAVHNGQYLMNTGTVSKENRREVGKKAST